MIPRPKVLIVEDNADLRRLYAIGLNQHGFEVKLAANGGEALDRVESERPDLILLDLVMPVMDGWEFVDKVNPLELEPHIPVIVITGQGSPGDRPPHPSFVGWLSKPTTIEEVVAVIAQAVPAIPSAPILPPNDDSGPHRPSTTSG